MSLRVFVVDGDVQAGEAEGVDLLVLGIQAIHDPALRHPAKRIHGLLRGERPIL